MTTILLNITVHKKMKGSDSLHKVVLIVIEVIYVEKG